MVLLAVDEVARGGSSSVPRVCRPRPAIATQPAHRHRGEAVWPSGEIRKTMIRAVKAGQPSSGAAQATRWPVASEPGPSPVEDPGAVGLGGQRHREQAGGAQQPTQPVAGMAGDDEGAHQRAAQRGQRGQRPAVVRPRRLAPQRTVGCSEGGVRDDGRRREPEEGPGDAGVHVTAPEHAAAARAWSGWPVLSRGAVAVIVVPPPGVVSRR